MILKELIDLLERPTMLLVAAAHEGRTAVGRGVGARVCEGGTRVQLWFSAMQWNELAQVLQVNAMLALTAVEPASYLSYQVKGPILSIAPAQEEDAAVAAAFIASSTAALKSLGVAQHQIRCWLRAEGLTRIDMRPCKLFTQTPGPNAGAAILR